VLKGFIRKLKEYIIMPDEIRKDIFGREVIIAASRSKRPGAFMHKPEENQVCPFCPGNEHMTEKAVLCLPDEKNWQVRVFPNKFPVLKGNEFKCTKTNLYQRFTPLGRHEIMVDTRDHDKEYEDMGIDNIELALVAMKMRYAELIKLKGINYVTIFKNKGREGGASLEHTHTQIIASPLFPEVISREMDESENFFKEGKKCGFCTILEEERRENKRIIYQNRHWVCIAPFSSVWPYQFAMIPKRHFSELPEMTYNELRELARTYKKVFSAFKKLFKDLPYNMIYHNFPRSELWHFHLEIFPRLVTHAGFEFFGLNVNIKPPEEAARELRKVID